LSTLPVAAKGICSRRITSSGTHHDATLSRSASSSSCSLVVLSGRISTSSTGRSPHLGCARPITAASDTPGIRPTTSSISAGLIHSPPDLIKSGGEWINPAEIEEVVGRIPGVSLAAVIGRAHPKWGERPVLLVEMRPDSTTSEQELLEALRDKVASWWVPDEVIRLEQMPLAATGKVDK